MISIDDIILPDTDETSCGKTTRMLNPDIDTYENTVIYEKYTTESKTLFLDDLKLIGQLLIKNNKIIVLIDVAGWFSHMFTLYNTKQGIYIAESYIWQKKIEKHKFDLDKLYEMLIQIPKYIGSYEKCEDRDNRVNGTSKQTFDECAKIWYDFWDAHHPTGSRGTLDYYKIECYIPESKDLSKVCENMNKNWEYVSRPKQILYYHTIKRITPMSYDQVYSHINNLLDKYVDSKTNPIQTMIKILKFVNQNINMINKRFSNGFRLVIINKIKELENELASVPYQDILDDIRSNIKGGVF